MDKQTGPEHGEVRGEAVRRAEGAALQWPEPVTAPPAVRHVVVLTQGAEDTHRGPDGARVQRRLQPHRESPLGAVKPVRVKPTSIKICLF